MNKYNIIGITGKKHNGKDTIADFFVEKYGFKKMAFAESTKNICSELFDFSFEQLHGDLKETPDDRWFGLSPRQIFQFIGTEMFRSKIQELHPGFEDKFWIMVMKNKIEKELKINPNAKFVFSDVRFSNEALMIKELNGLLIRVIRPNVNNNTDIHVSETESLDIKVDEQLMNDGTIQELLKLAEYIYLMQTDEYENKY